jgi:type IV secretion system protein VirD4
LNEKKRTIAIVIAVILGCAVLLYLGGVLGQLFYNYAEWIGAGGMSGQATIAPVDLNPMQCIPRAFTPDGLKSMLGIILVGGGIFAYVKLHDKFGGKDYDPRGFTKSKTGTYGTASWMTDKEMREVLEVSSPAQADGVILGEKNGSVVCMPKDTRLNRHIAVFGASGTMKSRAVIRNALFQAMKRGESVVITDSKAELYSDLSEMFRNDEHGYEVKVFNLVSPSHSDSWNCMSDLSGDTLMAQVLTDVIISNTSKGKGDHFWDNGEANLLKALVLLVDQDKSRDAVTKHLPAVYQQLTRHSERQLSALFEKLPLDHPARAPYNLFAQASDTVRSGIILGLGTRLQVLQNEAVRRIISQSDIDLTAPGRRRCAYFIILSDQDATMAFLSSLFFSFLFIKLIRYADSQPGGRCAVPVNLILDEFNNIGKLGGAADGSDFCRTLSVIRSRDIRVMLSVQSLSQLQNRYPNNLWSEIIGNCDIQLMLGCTDDLSAEHFSARSGDMSIEVNSTMTVRKTIALAQLVPQYRHTEGHGKRRLLTPDEVLRLPNEELLCIVRGCNILRLNKFDYPRHPMAKLIKPVSIHDYTPAAEFTPPPQTEPAPPPEKAPSPGPRKKSLYSSSKPPTEF